MSNKNKLVISDQRTKVSEEEYDEDPMSCDAKLLAL